MIAFDNLDVQDEHVQQAAKELRSVGIPVTGLYLATKDTDPGLEINSRYVLQYSSYCNPRYHLDRVELPGEEIFESNSLNDVIAFIMEH
jgi:hypothetical protein